MARSRGSAPSATRRGPEQGFGANSIRSPDDKKLINEAFIRFIPQAELTAVNGGAGQARVVLANAIANPRIQDATPVQLANFS